jgi:hypothetical protein
LFAQVSWGIDLATEHERWLAEEHFKQPVIVYNYPKVLSDHEAVLSSYKLCDMTADSRVSAAIVEKTLNAVHSRGLLVEVQSSFWDLPAPDSEVNVSRVHMPLCLSLQEIKAFYMKLNEDGKTVAAMDVLVPKVRASHLVPVQHSSNGALKRACRQALIPCGAVSRHQGSLRGIPSPAWLDSHLSLFA